MLAGTWESEVGNVTVKWPDGSVSPNRTLAIAVPSSCPGYPASSTPFTDASHGIVTADPVLSTTIVFGFAAATAEISALSVRLRSIPVSSAPSVSASPTKTTATLDDFARAAAVTGRIPASYFTETPLGAAASIPCKGVIVPLDDTPALPPPAVCGLSDPSAPMTAIELSAEPSGSASSAFFSKTVPSSASDAASA